MNARALKNRSAVRPRHAGSQSAIRPGARTEARIPDDKTVICMIIAAYLSAPGLQTTLGELTEIVKQLLKEKGYGRRSILIGLNRLATAYFAPD